MYRPLFCAPAYQGSELYHTNIMVSHCVTIIAPFLGFPDLKSSEADRATINPCDLKAQCHFYDQLDRRSYCGLAIAV